MGEIEELLLAPLVDGRVEGVRVALTEARASGLAMAAADEVSAWTLFDDVLRSLERLEPVLGR